MIGKTNFVKYVIVRSAVNLSFDGGENYWDYIDPKDATTLAHVIGHAGVSTTNYAPFNGLRLTEELTDRTTEIKNKQVIYFVHRGLLHLRPELIVENWSITPDRRGV